MNQQTRDEKINSLKRYKQVRDALLHEDLNELEHHLQRFVEFLEDDKLIQTILSPILNESNVSSVEWWDKVVGQSMSPTRTWDFPKNKKDELALRFNLIHDLVHDGRRSFLLLGVRISGGKTNDAKSWFLSIIARPFCVMLEDKLETAVQIPSQEARDLQAVPLERIPAGNEIKIFLSHKTVDKPLVMRYYKALSGNYSGIAGMKGVPQKAR